MTAGATAGATAAAVDGERWPLLVLVLLANLTNVPDRSPFFTLRVLAVIS